MRRSEVSALRWGDVAEAAGGNGVLVTVRRGKTNPEGEALDVRFVKSDVAGAVRTLRDASSPGPEDRVVPLSPFRCCALIDERQGDQYGWAVDYETASAAQARAPERSHR